jgi:hypothetical protein
MAADDERWTIENGLRSVTSRMRQLVLCAAILGACGGAPPPVPPPLPVPARAPAAPALPTAPVDYLEMHADRVVLLGEGAAVLLAADGEDRELPIFIGGTEGTSIDLRLRSERAPRPLTHDLLDHMLEQLGARLYKVQIDALRDNIFRGSVYLRAGGKLLRFDARPSDAIALALGSLAPIYVARAVLDRAGVSRAVIEQQVPTPAPSPAP